MSRVLRSQIFGPLKKKRGRNVESAPKATGVRLCTKATEMEPRTKITSKAD